MIKLSQSTIRPFQLDDAESIALHANNYHIWRNLRDLMPHPYAVSDAVEFITSQLQQPRATNFAIEVDGRAIGAIGVKLKDNIERIGAEVGYWLGEAYWGRGIVTEALTAFTSWALKEFELIRLEAIVFDWNAASARVLEKAGYVLEGVLRRSAVKDGVIIDRRIYAYVIG